ncbi:hypothetical protein FACS189475_07890 [Betaproteobacteria bacterium]|nr:hypothetical protein FACS189475_07890 [Betaproteobacteria bacterium]
MKRRLSQRKGRAFPAASIGSPTALKARNGFMRGFIVAGLAAATSAGRSTNEESGRETLRLALRGGAALAAGVAGANAIDRRDYGLALLAVAAGAAGLGAINYLFLESSSNEKESIDEQEKA